MSDIQEANKLDKITLWSILVNQVDEVQTDINSMVAITEKSQLVLEQQQSKLQSLLNLMEKLNQEEQLQIPVKDYLTEEQYQDYLLSQQEPEMLCEFDITLRDWLDWFYQELPFIKNKYLTFTNSITSVSIDLFIPDISYKWNRTSTWPLRQASFPSHVFKVHPCRSVYQHLTALRGQVVSHRMNARALLLRSSPEGHFHRLRPDFGYCE